MYRFVHTITTKINLRSAVIGVLSLVAVTLIPASVFAWGPSRPTFTMANPASYVTFNSITDNPSRGDERNFMRVREQTANNDTYTDDINLAAGKQYVVLVFYHNNASSSLNAGGTGIAHGAYARAEIPAIVKSGGSSQAAAYVGATNANPTSVYDDITFENKTGTDMALRYVPGSTTIHNFGATNGQTMPDTILSSGGVKLGYDSLNGDLPGCNDYAGYITFRVEADQPNFTFKKQVRVSGTKTWHSSVTAAPGTKVDYLLSYENTGTTVQNDVTFKDQLPKGINYIAGSSELTNGNNPDGKKVDDGIKTTGLDVGSYNPGARAFLEFSAKVGDVPCTTLKNTAAVETSNGYKKASASVTTGKSCALPTTGPVQIVAGFVGIGAITIGVVYYFMSRRDLEMALHDTQLHPTIHNGGGSLADVVPEHKAEAVHHEHKKPEHK